MKSNKGMGMILNNIGNIHRRQKRYFEAIQCYRESILCCDEDLKVSLLQIGINRGIKINGSQENLA